MTAFIVLHAASAVLEIYAFATSGLSGAIWANVAIRVLVIALFAKYGLRGEGRSHGFGGHSSA